MAASLIEGKVVCGEFVIPGGDTPALLDPVEEALDQIARPVQIWAKTDWVFTISLRRNVGPRTVFTGECSDPVRVVSSISKCPSNSDHAFYEGAGVTGERP
jgi:hypothetical protein